MLIILAFWRFVFHASIQNDTDASQGLSFSRLLSFFLFVSLIICGAFYLQRLNNNYEEALSDASQAAAFQTAQRALLNRNTHLSTIQQWIWKIDESIHRTDTLPALMIKQIANYSMALQPYPVSAKDASAKISPERGILLQYLLKSKIDSVSLSRLLQEATFAYADLYGCQLTGHDLRNIDLKGANLEAAILDSVKLDKADMCFANLKFASIQHTSIKNSNLDGMMATGLQMSEVDVRLSSFEWTDMSGAVLKNIRFAEANLTGLVLAKSSLDSVDLIACNFKRSNLAELRLKNIKIDSLVVSSNWPNLWNDWQMESDKDYMSNLKLVKDSLNNEYRWIKVSN